MKPPWDKTPEDWDEVWRRAKSPRIAPILFIAAAAIIATKLNAWVIFGMLLWLATEIGLIKDKKKYKDYYVDNTHENQNEYFEPVKTNASTQTQEDFTQDKNIIQKITDDAKYDLLQIKAASGVASGEVGLSLQKIVQKCEQMERDLIKEPHKLSHVQRIFTYYIPATQDLLLARGKALSNNDEVKIDEIDKMLARLAQAFEDFAAKMHGEDARSIDIDIRLLEQSLQQDLGFTKK